MASERKQMSRRTWNVLISLLFGAIVILAVVLIWMMFGNNGPSAVPQDEESNIVAVLEENLGFYSPDIEYAVGRIYMVADGYAVALLDVGGVNYRALIHNSDDGWKVLSYPRIVFSYEDFPEVPDEIVKRANEVGR